MKLSNLEFGYESMRCITRESGNAAIAQRPRPASHWYQTAHSCPAISRKAFSHLFAAPGLRDAFPIFPRPSMQTALRPVVGGRDTGWAHHSGVSSSVAHANPGS